MGYAIGFDVYGTLVDPLEMNEHLRPLVGDLADRFSELWREKQLEYAFRRGLMRRYDHFGVCTYQALLYTMEALKVRLTAEDQQHLLDEYQNLRPFPDVVPGIKHLKVQGHTVVAFSNGREASVRALLRQAGVLSALECVISVDDLKTFKPDPQVYAYLADKLNRPKEETWLVSTNPWDVIGAKSAGLRAVWLRRRPDAVFDPWGIEPDLVAANLSELAEQFRARQTTR